MLREGRTDAGKNCRHVPRLGESILFSGVLPIFLANRILPGLGQCYAKARRELCRRTAFLVRSRCVEIVRRARGVGVGMVRRDAWLLPCWPAEDVLNSLRGELTAVACARAFSIQPLGNRVAADT